MNQREEVGNPGGKRGPEKLRVHDLFVPPSILRDFTKERGWKTWKFAQFFSLQCVAVDFARKVKNATNERTRGISSEDLYANIFVLFAPSIAQMIFQKNISCRWSSSVFTTDGDQWQTPIWHENQWPVGCQRKKTNEYQWQPMFFCNIIWATAEGRGSSCIKQSLHSPKNYREAPIGNILCNQHDKTLFWINMNEWMIIDQS